MAGYENIRDKGFDKRSTEELEQLGYKQVVYVDILTEVAEGKHWNPVGKRKRMRLGRYGRLRMITT